MGKKILKLKTATLSNFEKNFNFQATLAYSLFKFYIISFKLFTQEKKYFYISYSGGLNVK